MCQLAGTTAAAHSALRPRPQQGSNHEDEHWEGGSAGSATDKSSRPALGCPLLSHPESGHRPATRRQILKFRRASGRAAPSSRVSRTRVAIGRVAASAWRTWPRPAASTSVSLSRSPNWPQVWRARALPRRRAVRVSTALSRSSNQPAFKPICIRSIDTRCCGLGVLRRRPAWWHAAGLQSRPCRARPRAARPPPHRVLGGLGPAGPSTGPTVGWGGAGRSSARPRFTVVLYRRHAAAMPSINFCSVRARRRVAQQGVPASRPPTPPRGGPTARPTARPSDPLVPL